ncbi:hypothetical protein [Endozoicomonas sp. ONNA2]|uniref:hypothetical protein n=1 Tax=Endozoicomonas sp. ONNA2 TaxID=2828741 RepID=UPI002148EC14|nr:hypothetical protein [Endozoicomonas sp. ONNA2]
MISGWPMYYAINKAFTMIFAYSARENQFSIDRVTPDFPPAMGTIWLEATEPEVMSTTG